MKKYFCVVAVLAMMVLSGCDNVKNVLSFPRGGPDEFSVTTNRPLVIPPDYTLRPPGENAGVVNSGAAETLFQGEADSDESADGDKRDNLTAGEEALLQHLENLKKDRASAPAPGSSSASGAAGGDPVVDALGEARRLETGEEGGTPAIEKSATEGGAKVESIFGDLWDLF